MPRFAAGTRDAPPPNGPETLRRSRRSRIEASPAALEAAELAESPAARGAVVISIWFDPADNGNLRQNVSYERAVE
jgi:hypothetical protein